MSQPFLEQRFLIVAGKGGVGKSTVCAALGLAAARAGRRTIIAELNTREKAPLFFGRPESGYDARQIFENLYSINIQPEPALREYGLMKLKFERVFDLVFENEGMKRLLKMIPGMNELLLLGKAFNLERERDSRGKPVWDLIIVDAPATGHGVSLLRLPDVILKVSKSGPMADEVRDMRTLLTDPQRTRLNLVSLPEEMPVRETQELMAQVRDVLRIPTGHLFINGIWPALFTPDQSTVMAKFDRAFGDVDPRLSGAVDCVEKVTERSQLHARYVRELHETIDMPAVELPYLFRHDFGFGAIDDLSKKIVAQMKPD